MSPGVAAPLARGSRLRVLTVDDDGELHAPVVLPVVFNATKAELAAAKKQHPHALKGPVKSQALVDAIDDALADKPPTQSRINGNSGL